MLTRLNSLCKLQPSFVRTSNLNSFGRRSFLRSRTLSTDNNKPNPKDDEIIIRDLRGKEQEKIIKIDTRGLKRNPGKQFAH